MISETLNYDIFIENVKSHSVELRDKEIDMY